MRHLHALATLLIAVLLLDACALGAESAQPPTPGAPARPVASEAQLNPTAAEPVAAAPTAGGERVTITFAAHNYQRQFYAPIIAAFEQENPGIHVQIANLDAVIKPYFGPDGSQWIDDSQWSREILSAADTASLSPTPEEIAKGWLYDLTPLMEADATFDRDDFYPGMLRADGQHGGIYTLPQVANVSLIAYNKDLWAARGLPAPRPDWSWSDMLAAAQQLVQKRGDAVEVYGMGGWDGTTVLERELEAAGVKFDPISPPRLDDSAIMAALERVTALARSGTLYIPPYMPPGPGGGPGEFPDLVRDQRVGIFPGDLFAASQAKPTFATELLPDPNAAAIGYGYVISSGTLHPQESWRWVEFLSRHVEGWNFDASVIPARKSVAERDGVWQRLDPATAAALEAALNRPTAQRAPVLPNLGIRAEEIFRAAVSEVVHGKKPALAAMHEAQTAVEQLHAEEQPRPTPATDRIVVATPEQEVPAGATRITFGALLSATEPMREVARAFNRQHPDVFVEVTTIEAPPEGAALATLADKLDCFAWRAPDDREAATGLLDLQPLIDADAAFPRDDYPGALLAPFKRGTGLYGLPYAVDFRVLNYNQAAFDAAGLAYPSATWTLDDLLHAAQQLTQGTGESKQYGFASTVMQAADVFFFLDRYGAPATRGSGSALQPNFADPNVEQAIRTYLDLLLHSSPHRQLQGYTRGALQNDAAQLVAAGRVGMWFDFGANFWNLDTGGYQGAPRAIAPPPLDGSAVTQDDFRMRGLYISARTPKPEACWAWLKELSGAVVGLQGMFPARSSLAESDAFKSQALPGAAEVYGAYRAAMERAPGVVPAGIDRSEFDDYWFLRAIDRALQGKDLARELADAQTLTEQFLACVRGGAKGSTCATQVDPDYKGWNG